MSGILWFLIGFGVGWFVKYVNFERIKTDMEKLKNENKVSRD